MLREKMIRSINNQINREQYSAYLYLSMASYAAAEGLSGFANWFTIQMQEEMFHAEKMYNYVNQQGGRVLLEAIEQPPADFSSMLDLFEKTLEHEKGVTAMINNLVVEEEASPTEIIQKLKFIGKDGRGLLMIDKDLAARVFTVTAAIEQ